MHTKLRTKNLKAKLAWITTPKLTFAEVEVQTSHGKAVIQGRYKWDPVTIQPEHAEEFEKEIEEHNNLFDFAFDYTNDLGEKMAWVFDRASVLSKNMRNNTQYTLEFYNAQLVMR